VNRLKTGAALKGRLQHAGVSPNLRFRQPALVGKQADNRPELPVDIELGPHLQPAKFGGGARPNNDFVAARFESPALAQTPAAPNAIRGRLDAPQRDIGVGAGGAFG
jgi:hypothetical protein